MQRQIFIFGTISLVLLLSTCKKEKTNPCDASIAANLPAVTIDSVYRDGDKIVITGNVLQVGQDDAGLSAHGVVWSQNLTPSLQNGAHQSLGATSASGHFTVKLDSLLSPGDYQFRTYAINCAGTSYSTDNFHFNSTPDFWANFSFDDSIGIAPFTISFINKSFGASSYIWDFGDGNTSTLPNPKHEYKMPGRYTVRLTAIKDSRESVATSTLKIKATTFITTFNPTGGTNNSGVSVFESGTKYRVFGNRSGLTPYRLSMETDRKGILTYEHITSGDYPWVSVLMLQNSEDEYYDITTYFNDAPLIIKKTMEAFDNKGNTITPKFFFQADKIAFTGFIHLGNGKQFMCGTTLGSDKSYVGYIVDFPNAKVTKVIDIPANAGIYAGIALKVNNRIIISYQTVNSAGTKHNVISTYNLNGQSGYLVYANDEQVASISAISDDQSNFYILEKGASNALQIRGFTMNGEVLWTHAFAGQDTGARSLVFTKDKKIVVCYRENNVLTLKKLNLMGEMIWRKEIPLTGAGSISGMIEVSDGGFLMTGSINNRVLLIKTDFEGEITQ